MIRILLPLLCLITGLFIGRWWGGASSQEAEPRSAAAAQNTVSRTSVIETKPASHSSGVRGALTEVAGDFSPKRARQLAESLTLADISVGLADLAATRLDAGARSMRMELMRAWARRDVGGAWKAALAMPESPDRAALLGSVASVQAETNPEAAVKLVMSVGKPAERRKAFTTFFDQWGRADPKAAVAYLNAHPDLPVDQFTVSSIVSSTAARDPALAATLALSVPVGTFDSSMTSAMSAWIEADAAGARRWIESLREPQQRDRALKAFVSSRAHIDPKVAMEVAGQITASDMRHEARRSILSNWLRSDPVAAGSYLATEEGQKAGAGMEVYLSSALSELTVKEQNDLLARLPDGQIKEGLLAGVIRSASSKGNYAQVVQILNAMPDSRDRDRSLHELAITWSKNNAKAVSDWIDKQPDSSDRDLLVAGYSVTLASHDPQAALKLAKSIPDLSVQTSALKNVFLRWHLAEPEAAKSWLAATPDIPAREKQALEALSKIGGTYSSTPNVRQRR